jgi:hypothetical protein
VGGYFRNGGELVESSDGTMNCFCRNYFLRGLHRLELWEKEEERCLAGTEKVWRGGERREFVPFSVSRTPSNSSEP